MRLRLAHLRYVDIFELLTGLDEAWLGLGLLLILRLLVWAALITCILHASEDNLRKRVVVLLHRDGCS